MTTASMTPFARLVAGNGFFAVPAEREGEDDDIGGSPIAEVQGSGCQNDYG